MGIYHVPDTLLNEEWLCESSRSFRDYSGEWRVM